MEFRIDVEGMKKHLNERRDELKEVISKERERWADLKPLRKIVDPEKVRSEFKRVFNRERFNEIRKDIETALKPAEIRDRLEDAATKAVNRAGESLDSALDAVAKSLHEMNLPDKVEATVTVKKTPAKRAKKAK